MNKTHESKVLLPLRTTAGGIERSFCEKNMSHFLLLSKTPFSELGKDLVAKKNERQKIPLMATKKGRCTYVVRSIYLSLLFQRPTALNLFFPF